MIQVNELRVGIWFEMTAVKMQLTQRRMYALLNDIVEGDGETLHNLQPIPLTAEILVMCGFEINKNFIYPDRSVGAKWKKGFYLIGEFYTGEGYGIEWIIGGGHSICPTQIKYLHQLQNLYYALTGGEELEIKLFKEQNA